MTVAELIEELGKFEADTEVFVSGCCPVIITWQAEDGPPIVVLEPDNGEPE